MHLPAMPQDGAEDFSAFALIIFSLKAGLAAGLNGEPAAGEFPSYGFGDARCATVSTWCVWGNMSKARREERR